MRELKFRIWDTTKNEYLLDENGSIQEFSVEWLACNGLFDENEDIDNYIFEQYTGEKDKRGQEIAQNDIVDCVKKGLEDTDVKRATIESVINYWDSVWLYDEITIIGNIHENPELLEDK